MYALHQKEIDDFVAAYSSGHDFSRHTVAGPLACVMKFKGGQLYWREGKTLVQIKLSDIVDIFPGMQTDSFQALRLAPAVAPSCFSIHTTTTTYDMQAADSATCQLFLQSLHVMLTQAHAAQGGSGATQGRTVTGTGDGSLSTSTSTETLTQGAPATRVQSPPLAEVTLGKK